MIKTVAVTIRGLSPLLMHAYPMVPIEGLEKKTPEEQAEHSAYRIPGGRMLYVPGVNLQRCLVAGAAYSKGKGRATLAKPAAACLLIEEQYLALGVEVYTIDSRPVVIPSTKGRIVRHRPCLRDWTLQANLAYDDTLLSGDQVRRIVDDAGKHVGLLDFRPEKKGPFGRFVVDGWKATGG